MNRRTLFVAALAALLVLGVAVPRPSYAVDGVIEINQAKALAGGVTKNNFTPPVADAPGFPVTIYQPGSYRLTGNLSVPAGQSGIEVAQGTQNVTIDLNGFSIVGALGSFIGISLGNGSYCRIHNGTIAQMGYNGIDAVNKGALIEDVRVRNCGGSGIAVAEGIVRRCWAESNTGGGISAQIVEECRAQFNGQGGIFVSGSGRATGNHVEGNAGSGIRCGGKIVVEGNAVTGTTGNFGAGIELAGPGAICAIIGNVIAGNVGPGIIFNGADATKTGIASNVIQGNASAFAGGTPTTMSGNAAQTP